MKKPLNPNDFTKSPHNLKSAADHLSNTLKNNDLEDFLLTLKKIIAGSGGTTILAERTRKSRTSLYKTLSKTGNPYLHSINEILHALGLHLVVVPKKEETIT